MNAQSREPGWYQDPFGTGPEDRRYWDGETWLAAQQVQPTQAQAPGAPAYLQQPEPPQQPVQGGWGDRDEQPSRFGFAGFGGQPASPDDRLRTPDGVELAGWGRRFVAYLIDGIVLGIVSLLLGAVLGIWGPLTELLDAATTTDPSTDLTPQFEAFLQDNAGTLLMFSLLQLVASGIYHVVLTATKGRTVGKRIVGIRVRLREREGLPIWRAAVLRWLVHHALPNLGSGVPGLGFIAALFPLIDGLWPLWDARRQAIHDKAAKTSVVRG